MSPVTKLLLTVIAVGAAVQVIRAASGEGVSALYAIGTAIVLAATAAAMWIAARRAG